EVWAGKVAYFEKNANFTQKYKALKKGSLKIQGVLKGQACSNVDNTCIPFKEPFSVLVEVK
ncbi:MAG: hypothetical protein ACRCVT_01915, partial [Leadbetterella sp.]